MYYLIKSTHYSVTHGNILTEIISVSISLDLLYFKLQSIPHFNPSTPQISEDWNFKTPFSVSTDIHRLILIGSPSKRPSGKSCQDQTAEETDEMGAKEN